MQKRTKVASAWGVFPESERWKRPTVPKLSPRPRPKSILDVPPIKPKPIPGQKAITITQERLGHKDTVYSAMTNLGPDVIYFRYEVWQTIGRLTEQIQVTEKKTSNLGDISFNIPYRQHTTLDRRIAIKWPEQEIAGQRYRPGWTEGVVIRATQAPAPKICSDECRLKERKCTSDALAIYNAARKTCGRVRMECIRDCPKP